MTPDDISKLPVGKHIIEDTEAYTIVVNKSPAGWTEEIEWKEGHEPEPEPLSLNERMALLEKRITVLEGKQKE